MRDLIVRAYAARAEGRVDELMSAFHPDAVFHLTGSKDILPIAGAIEGHGNLREAMRGFIGTFEFRNRDIRSMIFQDNRAAVHSRIQVKFLPSGLTSTTDVLDLFTFRDGKIIELLEFADTALINRMLASANS